MQRYNVFKTVHFALQDALFNSAKSLQQTPEWPQQVSKAVEMSRLLMRTKEAAILPAVDSFEPSVVDAVKQAHRVADAEAQKLQKAFDSSEDINLNVVFNRYMITQLNSMLRSEEMINPVLWYYYSDAELQNLEAPLKELVQQ